MPKPPLTPQPWTPSWFLSKGSGQGNGCVLGTEVWSPPGSAEKEMVTLSPEISVPWGATHPATSTMTPGLWDREENRERAVMVFAGMGFLKSRSLEKTMGWALCSENHYPPWAHSLCRRISPVIWGAC